MAGLYAGRGVPDNTRSDDGSEFTAKAVRAWENGYNESNNGKLRDGLLNGEIFFTLEGEKGKPNWRVVSVFKTPGLLLKGAN